jgi:membrane protease YdiL (CAAX protease family)
VGVFLPLLAIGFAMLRSELQRNMPWRETWRTRLRFHPLTSADWIWSLGALLLIAVFSVATLAGVQAAGGEVSLHPSFMQMRPLTAGRYWILAVWLPFWLLNIMSEEIVWRGIVLPRQEAAFGKCAWLLQGGGWLLFHLAFGPALLLALWPTLFILPFVAQRRKNTWTGVLIHAGLNGPGFLAVALGWV